jgi:thiamine pyrophosphokinase
LKKKKTLKTAKGIYRVKTSPEQQVFLNNFTCQNSGSHQKKQFTEFWAVFFSPANEKNLKLPDLNGYKLMAVDGGIKTLLDNKLYPHIFLGDRDSFTADFPPGFPETEYHIFPPRKDFLDGEAAINHLKERPLAKVLFFSFFQGRWDMTLTHFLMLYQMRDFAGRSFFIVDNGLIFLAAGPCSFHAQKGQKFSLVPLEKMTKVSVSGALYELHEKNLEPGSGFTLSNCFTEETVHIKMYGEALYLFITINGDNQ